MESFFTAAKAPLEHHFDNHEFCGMWCRIKRGETVKKGKYQDKKEEPELYGELKSIVEKFISVERLSDVNHTFETQVNESLNQSVSLFVPKNRTYSMTMALASRVKICCGVHISGQNGYWSKVFEALELHIPDITVNYLKKKQAVAKQRKQRQSIPEIKRLRSENWKEKVKKCTEEHIKSKAKGQTYGRGKGFDIALEHEDEKLQHAQVQSRKQTPICPHCGKKGHKTTKSRQCIFHGKIFSKTHQQSSQNTFPKTNDSHKQGCDIPGINISARILTKEKNSDQSSPTSNFVCAALDETAVSLSKESSTVAAPAADTAHFDQVFLTHAACNVLAAPFCFPHCQHVLPSIMGVSGNNPPLNNDKREHSEHSQGESLTAETSMNSFQI
jgi:hypothetical protein